MSRHKRRRGQPRALERTVSMPAYLPRFTCIGPACESSCCSGWTVPVDSKSYERYQALTDPELRAELRDNLVQLEPGKLKEGWAFRLREDDNTCHFLNPKSLCRLQQRKGMDFLCTTCATYPRVAVSVDGAVQRAAVLSCPEIVRLALFSPRAMHLVRRREPASTRDELAAEITTSTAHLGDPMASFPLFREYTLAVLRSREISLEARLVAVGLALSGLRSEKLYPADVEREFRLVLEDLAAIQERVSQAPPRPEMYPRLLRELAPDQFFNASAAGRYMACAARVLRGLGLAAGDVSDAVILAQYAEAKQRFYEPYVAAHPYVLENFLINSVYATAFPFTLGRDVFDDYVMFVLRYCLLKLHLVGLATSEGKLTDAIVVQAVHPFQRAMDHNESFRNYVFGLIEVPKESPMDALTSLVVS